MPMGSRGSRPALWGQRWVMGASPGRQEGQHGPLRSCSSQDILPHKTGFTPPKHLRAFAQAVLVTCFPPSLPLSYPSGFAQVPLPPGSLPDPSARDKCFLQVPSKVCVYTIMALATLCCTHLTPCLSSSPMDWEPQEVWICLCHSLLPLPSRVGGAP